MPGFTPDASVTLPWCFSDEATPWTESLLNRIVAGEEVLVPAHWAMEVANGLLMAARRGRVTEQQVSDFVEDLASLPIRIEPASAPAEWSVVLDLAQRHRLTAYDAAYLELAMRTQTPLATLDGDLLRAAVAEQVQLVEEL